MRRVASLAAACFVLAPVARAAVVPPYFLGAELDAGGSGGKNKLTITQPTGSPGCPAPNMIWVVQSAVSPLATPPVPPHAFGAVTDSLGLNTFTSTGANFGNGAIIKAVGYINNSTGNLSAGLPGSATISLQYTSSNMTFAKQAVAVCVAGAAITGPEGIMGAGKQAPPPPMPWGTPAPTPPYLSNQPTSAPPAQLNFGNIVFAVTVVAGASTDSWTESCGWTSLAAVSDGTNVLHVAYAIVGDQTPAVQNAPPPYCATNSISRAWVTNFMPYRLQPCTLTTGDAGSC